LLFIKKFTWNAKLFREKISKKTEKKFHRVIEFLLKTIKEDWVNGL